MGVRVDALIRTGVNVESLVAEGANVDRKSRLWFRCRLLRTERSQLTVGLDWEYRKTFVVTPYEFAQDVLDGESLQEASLLYSVKQWTARGTVAYAHAFSPAFGLRANAAAGLYEEPFTDGVSRATYRAGVLGEYDLHPGVGIPLGITLGYTKGFPSSDSNAGLSGILLGLWYTGRDAFSIGTEAGFMQLPSTDDSQEDADALFGLLTVSYDF